MHVGIQAFYPASFRRAFEGQMFPCDALADSRQGPTLQFHPPAGKDGAASPTAESAERRGGEIQRGIEGKQEAV